MKFYNDKELEEIYQKKVKLPDSYFKKYELLPPCPLESWGYKWGNRDFPRVWCTLDFKEWIEKYNLSDVGTLGITCLTDPETEFLKAKEIFLFEYPEYDLHTIHKNTSIKLDFFIFNQTIEHLYNPYIAIESIFNIMKPGGYVFTSVPNLNIPHMTPTHYGGFNSMGLALLFDSAGFEIIEIGQWGNLDYIKQLWSSHEWPGYEKLNKNGFIANERDNICQCWILARRPLVS